MDELAKIRRVIAARVEGAPHETLLVVDATTGQNGRAAGAALAETAGVTGVALTKLDGSAKGGVAIAIAHELRTAREARRRGGGARRPAPVRRARLRPCARRIRLGHPERVIYSLFALVVPGSIPSIELPSVEGPSKRRRWEWPLQSSSAIQTSLRRSTTTRLPRWTSMPTRPPRRAPRRRRGRGRPGRDGDLAHRADLPGVLRLPARACPPDARDGLAAQVEVAPLHNLFAVEMDTVERMGAVSLPATYAGAALSGAPHQFSHAAPIRLREAATSDARAMRGRGASPVPLVAFASSVPDDPAHGVERGR